MEKLMDYQTMAQEVVFIIRNLYQMSREYSGVLDSVASAIQKYGTDMDKVALKSADVDHKKMIWQILIDLRFARGTDYDYDMESYRNDTVALQKITSFLEEHTTEFCREGSEVIDISELDNQEYLELIEKYGLKNG